MLKNHFVIWGSYTNWESLLLTGVLSMSSGALAHGCQFCYSGLSAGTSAASTVRICDSLLPKFTSCVIHLLSNVSDIWKESIGEARRLSMSKEVHVPMANVSPEDITSFPLTKYTMLSLLWLSLL